MDALDRMAERLHAEGRPRVWSLIVTAFGDVAAPRRAPLSAARLAALMEPAGIGGGAVRTALSRLVADGLLVRSQTARAGLHAPSPALAAEIAAATPLIYDAPSRGWEVSVGPRPPRALPLAPSVWLSREPSDGAGARFAAQPIDAPDLADGQALDPAHLSASRRLDADLDDLSRSPGDPLRSATARLLLVHRWRRLVLRWPEVPDGWLPPGQAAPRPRVERALTALRAPSERWWDEAIGPGPAGAPVRREAPAPQAIRGTGPR